MVCKRNRFLFLPLLLLVTGCTVAVPDVTSLSSAPLFSSKSVNPFEQDDPSGKITFSGYCLPGTTGFEYRLNEHAIWNSVPATPPSPLNIYGEYLDVASVYDVDCSDGTYDFYLFKSAVMANFTANSVTPTSSDPYKIEIRSLGAASLPSIVYTRPRPTYLAIHQDYNSGYYDSFGKVETGRTFKFVLGLGTVQNAWATVAHGETLLTNISLTSMSGTALPAGQIVKADCATAIDTDYLTFEEGEEEKTFCYQATSVNPGDTIKMEASAPGLLGAQFFIAVYNQNSVTSSLFMSGGSMLPDVFLRGVSYTLGMNLLPLYNTGMNRYVNAFSGNLSVDPSSSLVTLGRSGSDTECPLAAPGAMTCTTTNWNKSFVMEINTSYPHSELPLTISATPTASCGASCSLYDTSLTSSFNMTDSIAVTYKIPVATGPATFDHPYLRLNGPYARWNECVELKVALANVNDQMIPPSSTMTFTIQAPDSNITFYPDYSCGSGATSTSSATLYSGMFSTYRYFKSNTTIPSDGRLRIQITDGVTTWNKEFQIKSDN